MFGCVLKRMAQDIDIAPSNLDIIRQRQNAHTAADHRQTHRIGRAGIKRTNNHLCTILDSKPSHFSRLGLKPGRVVLDLVRTDLAPDLHLGFLLELPVILPVTRGLVP